MPFSDAERHLRDILDSIDQIDKFVGDMDFTQDEKTKAAVERKIQILTEAVIRLEEIEGAQPIPRSNGAPTAAWETSCATPIIACRMKLSGTR